MKTLNLFFILASLSYAQIVCDSQSGSCHDCVSDSVPVLYDEQVTLGLSHEGVGQLVVGIPFEGEVLTLQLEESSVFGENTRFLAEDESGQLQELENCIECVYTGRVMEDSDFTVSAVLTENGLLATVIRPGKESIQIEPVSGGKAARGQHRVSVHEIGDYTGEAHECGLDQCGDLHDSSEEEAVQGDEETARSVGAIVTTFPMAVMANAGGAGSSTATLPPTRVMEVLEYEIGVEIGSRAYLNNYGNASQREAAAQAAAASIPANLNARFLASTGTSYVLGTVIIRRSAGEEQFIVANGNDGAGLNAFRDYWNANPQEVGNTHDLAVYHVRSSPSGLAFVNTVGSSNRYALTASNGPTSWANSILVHEFGHSWNLRHNEDDPIQVYEYDSGNSLPAQFYETRPRNFSGSNAAGGIHNFISPMGGRNIGRLSTDEALTVIGVKNENRSRSAGTLIPNPEPVAPFGHRDIFNVVPNAPATLDVVANDYDVNNDVLDAQILDTVSQQGGTIELSPGTGPGGRNQLIYTPPANLSQNLDFFHYTVCDSSGLTDWCCVYVQPLPLPQLTSPEQVSGGDLGVFIYQITTTTDILSYDTSAAPAWLAFDASTATFSGIPPSTGTFTFPVTFTNQRGATTANLTIIIVSDDLAEALDISVATAGSGDDSWFRQASVTFDSEDAAQSGDINDGQSSVLSIDVTGPDTITFRWRVSSEEIFDFLKINLDNQVIAGISGEQDWMLFSLDVPAGPHTISWVYDKDGSVSVGADAGWVDDVRFQSRSAPIITNDLELTANIGAPLQFGITTNDPNAVTTVENLPAGLIFDSVNSQIIGTPTVVGTFAVDLSSSNSFGTTATTLVLNVIRSMSVAADAPDLIFQTGGDVPWFIQTTTKISGPSALQSGLITPNQSSWIETTVPGPGILNFSWSVSSEQGADFLTILLNGRPFDQISGFVPFSANSVEIPSGRHTIRWEYGKNGTIDEGSDAAWIDGITLAGYGGWLLANKVPADALPSDDLDGDGYPILFEYALGGVPGVSDTNLLPLPDITAERVSLAFDKPSGVFDVQYRAEVSSNLVDWSAEGLIVLADNATSFEVWDLIRSESVSRRFMRIVVTLTNP